MYEFVCHQQAVLLLYRMFPVKPVVSEEYVLFVVGLTVSTFVRGLRVACFPSLLDAGKLISGVPPIFLSSFEPFLRGCW